MKNIIFFALILFSVSAFGQTITRYTLDGGLTTLPASPSTGDIVILTADGDVSTQNDTIKVGTPASHKLINSSAADTMVVYYEVTPGLQMALSFASNKWSLRADARDYRIGTDVVAANDLTLGTTGGYVFNITGSTQINAITTSGWKSGTEITLIFASTPTVKHNTSGGGGTAVILLDGGADLSATANDVLKLTFDGTRWLQSSPVSSN